MRLESELWDALVADAEENGRTVTQTVRFRLAQSPAIADRLDAPEASPA